MDNENEEIKLEDLGYKAFFELNRTALGVSDQAVGRIIAEYKEVYRVRSVRGEYLARITGKQMFNAAKREDYPAVGDWVAITELDQETATIRQIFPRMTILRRKRAGKQDVQVIAANVDVAFIIGSVDRDYNLNRFERYCVLAKEGGVKPVIVLNKIDLIPEAERISKMNEIKDRFNDPDILLTSAVMEQGLDILMNYIVKGNTYCFLGSSGAGKSSLINKLLGSDVIKTTEISDHAVRGKHTTTARELYLIRNGGIVIDNPGMREVGIADAGEGIKEVFAEIAVLSQQCKFVDCTHTHEPGCAVLASIREEKLDEEKYANYRKLEKENAYYRMTDLEKRRKDRAFGKFVKHTLKQLKELEP
ncbi:MAG: ribosome small subunit-dependent GTPase A [Candidatus Omnitrophica bacterium]|nr:ribosome small subunit-dependent GTPase A [Candidatus Omnitrophota bacterium]